MILDSSAIVAILRLEPEAAVFANAIQRTAAIRVSGATVLEVSMVLGPELDSTLDAFLEAAGARTEPVSVQQIQLARTAFRQFGRGSGHPARLNFGDCFAYALAKDKGEALLYKGNDFVHTDIPAAV